jgi:hypothetical protein
MIDSKANTRFTIVFLSLNDYRAFHVFELATFPDGGSVLGSSQFQLPQLPPKILLDSKVDKIDPKIIISNL